jgi:predicted dehydrogenase
MSAIPFALIGAGMIGRVHAANIARRPDARLP